MKKILTALTFLLISTLFFACSDSKEEPVPPVTKATLEVTATLDLTATEKLPTRAVTLADLTYVITNTGAKTEVDKGTVPADGKLKALTLDAGTYSVAITSSATGMPKPGFDTPIYGRTQTVALKAGDNKKLEVKSTQQNAGINFTYADFAGAAVVAKIVHADGTLTYAANDDKKIGYFGPAAVEASFTVDGVAIKVNGKDKETLTLKAGELWKIKLSKTAATGAWVLSDTEKPEPVVDELLEGDAYGYFLGGTTSTELGLELSSVDEKLLMYLQMFTTPTDFANVGLAEGEYTMAPRGQSSYAPMTFLQGGIENNQVGPSCFYGYDDAGKFIEYWLPSSGKIVVSKVGDIYTITATLSGTYYENWQGGTNKPFTDLVWTFKGKITKWTDMTPDPIMDEIKDGAWSAAGTGGMATTPGPDTFNLTLTKKLNLLEFVGWAGEKGLPFWLYVNNGKFTLDPTKDLAPQFEGFEPDEQLFFRAFVLIGTTVHWDTESLFPATFDKAAQTLKLFARFTIDGNPYDAHFGYLVVTKTGVRLMGDAYKQLTLTGSPTRTGMSVSYSDKISAEELNALLAKGKVEMVNLPVDVKVDTPMVKGEGPMEKGYVYSYNTIFR